MFTYKTKHQIQDVVLTSDPPTDVTYTPFSLSN